MNDLEQLLEKLVVNAAYDATDGMPGLSLATRTTMSAIREVFTEMVRSRVNPLLARAVEAAQTDARADTGRSAVTREAMGKVRDAYDDLFEVADEF